ncbi:Gfo/Idh/MocA family protein [Conyzicola sp.]|uniref:Gfo/Idh/MocA family protein n=1 Tax=Conyzicola sp. TaxID=1969404 RepID=UPI00398A3D38
MSAARGGPVGVGIIGAGYISGQYLSTLTAFPDLRVLFVADLDLARARAQAEAFGVPRFGTVDQLLDDDDVEIVVNLTIPAVHAEVGRRIVTAGKHVWSEKPLALDHESGAALLAAAADTGVRVACAPDTVLGAGIQSALRAIDRGDIGEPLTATTLFQVGGPEAWHPDPEFLFARGAGPLFDMGPYYVTTLVHVFGAAARVSAVSSTSHTERTIATGPRAGTAFAVEVPTHHAALIGFAGGQSAASTFSFQDAQRRVGFVEISGTEGTLVLPDPNKFEGDSLLWRFGQEEPTVVAAQGSTHARGSGVLDLARAIRGDETERASGALALHVLDVLLAIERAAETGAVVPLTSTVEQPARLSESWDPAAATL